MSPSCRHAGTGEHRKNVRNVDDILPHFAADRRRKKMLKTVDSFSWKNQWKFHFFVLELEIAVRCWTQLFVVWHSHMIERLDLPTTSRSNRSCQVRLNATSSLSAVASWPNEIMMNVCMQLQNSHSISYFLYKNKIAAPIREKIMRRCEKRGERRVNTKYIKVEWEGKKRAPTTTFLCFWFKIKLSSIKKSLRR